jgi:hypothetical protein
MLLLAGCSSKATRMKCKALFLVALIALNVDVCAQAQDNVGQSSLISGPVRLAESTWPIFHANTHATAASPHQGPGDVQTATLIGDQETGWVVIVDGHAP